MTDKMREAEDARRFPDNTCPASRHAQMIGEALVNGDPCPQLTEDPAHCGESILATVAALWKARTALSPAAQPAPVAEPVASIDPLVDCGECRTQGCIAGKCRAALAQKEQQ